MASEAFIDAWSARSSPEAPLPFTFHHNQPQAYHAVGVAILDAGLACSATFCCPAEMGGSIHIHGTASSIVDSVFVCRKWHGVSPVGLESTLQLIERVGGELTQLRAAGMKPSRGDIRCIVLGHLTRGTISRFRDSWDCDLPVVNRLELFARAMANYADHERLVEAVVAAQPRCSDDTLPLFPKDEQDAVPI